MILIKPVLVALDASTLGIVSRDFWCDDGLLRDKSRKFIKDLTQKGIYLSFCHSLIEEILRHGNDHLVRDRLRFLGTLPMIAWVKPYDEEWYIGSSIDICAKELDAFLQCPKPEWRQITNTVRDSFWQTGTGNDMFGRHQEDFWLRMREEYLKHADDARRCVSVTRVQHGLSDMTLEETYKATPRPLNEYGDFSRQLMTSMYHQIRKHGDKRWNDGVSQFIREFTESTIDEAKALSRNLEKFVLELADQEGIPHECIHPQMTVSEFGDIIVYAKRLKLFQKRIRHSSRFSVADVPIDSLPSYAFNRRLSAIQQKAERVSGSDMGDTENACLSLYCNKVQVDKRTIEYIRQVAQVDGEIESLTKEKFFKFTDYPLIPQIISKET